MRSLVLAVAVAGAAAVSGCAGVPPALGWAVAGAGLGYAASINTLGAAIVSEQRK